MTIRNLLVWKKHIGQGIGLYHYSHELIMYACAGTGDRFKSADIIEGVKGWNDGCPDTKIHPTQKPVALFEKFVLDSTEDGGIVLDTFAGSGTLAVAALKTKRNYICFELQDKYCIYRQRQIT